MSARLARKKCSEIAYSNRAKNVVKCSVVDGWMGGWVDGWVDGWE